MKVNNNSSTINAEADLSSLDIDGFTLNWTTNDAVATQILYLALAPGTAPSESLDLGTLSGGSIGGCNCRFNATFAWSNGNTTMTITIGARTVGYANPTIGSATWTLNPTTLTSKLQSSTGGFHICDTNTGGGNCLPSTVGGSTFAPLHIPTATRSSQRNMPTPTRLAQSNTPTSTKALGTRTPKPSRTPTATSLSSVIESTRTPTRMPTPTLPDKTMTPTATLWDQAVTPSPSPTPTPSVTFTATVPFFTPTALATETPDDITPTAEGGETTPEP
jgi:hypothetical protein